MNNAHIHLLLNHFPLATLLFGFFILAAGKIRYSETVVRVALGLLIVGGCAGAAAFLTGNLAEDALKDYPAFSHKYIHEHELAGKFALISSLITAAVAAGCYYLSKKKGAVPRSFVILLFVINFWALTVVARTNYLGGQISHQETRPDSKPAELDYD